MSRHAAVVLGNAVVWAAVILATSAVLKGTPYAGDVLLIVGGGAAGSIIVVGGGIRKLRGRGA